SDASDIPFGDPNSPAADIPFPDWVFISFDAPGLQSVDIGAYSIFWCEWKVSLMTRQIRTQKAGSYGETRLEIARRV
ncbi:MAG TPA: hypothetical protein VNI77_04175, partial [Nitrososphaera sp.]|nr:hypothetical protein [Nitrososphaera sp.]